MRPFNQSIKIIKAAEISARQSSIEAQSAGVFSENPQANNQKADLSRSDAGRPSQSLPLEPVKI